MTGLETTEFIDNENIIPVVQMNIIVNDKIIEVALLGNEKTIQMIRILVPNLERELVTAEDLRIIQVLKEHMMSILRLNYDPTVNSAVNVHNFRKSNEYPNLSFTLQTVINIDFDVRNNMIIGSYLNSFDIRNQLKLLSDSTREEIPIQYRFLSLYKLLELEFKVEGSWNLNFSLYIEEFNEEFQSLNISTRKLENYIHEQRDKCAHIKSNKDILGITELSQKDLITLDSFFPLMRKISILIINRRYSNEIFGIQIN